LTTHNESVIHSDNKKGNTVNKDIQCKEVYDELEEYTMEDLFTFSGEFDPIYKKYQNGE